ncbi:hypothetical protein ABIF70_005185 [Bradyrhizobium japonicum]
MSENVRPIPAYEAFVVDETGKTAHWTKVGAAWIHDDRKGMNISLAAGLAVSGKLVLRAPDVERKQKSSAKR